METLMSDGRQNSPKAHLLAGRAFDHLEVSKPWKTSMSDGRQNSQKAYLLAGRALDYLKVSLTTGDFNVHYPL